ncbi:MAG: asparagine--tRNA ligase, partial [Oscillospiraceae bacterium]|nr:asparagine--tRNA ligase [Oscillospiraceae bacterium]
MEKLILIKDIYASPEAYAGKKIAVGGWVRTLRSSNAFGFAELNDGTCFKGLQAVLESEKLSNYAEAVKSNVGAAVIVRGVLELTPEAKQPIELKVEEFEVEGASSPDYPLQKKKHSMEYLRTIAHLRPRTNTFNAVFRIRSEAAYAIHSFFHE